MGVLVDSTNAFGSTIVRGIMRYVNLKRRWLLLKDLRGVLDKNVQWPKLDGVITAGVPQWVMDHALADVKGRMIQCSAAGNPDVCPIVGLDGGLAGEQAAEHLMNCRLEHFAFYGSDTLHKLSNQRFMGFKKAIEARGFRCIRAPMGSPTHEEWTVHGHRPRLIEWLRTLPKPIGIMTVDDMTAHDLAEACLEGDVPVPEQVAIVGVNNDDLLCEGAWPPLSSVEGDFSRMGYMAAQILDRLLAGETLTPEERLNLLPPLGVVQRQSTNILAVKDPNLAKAIHYIREHACDPCSVQDVLEVVPVGRRWLERQFVSQLGRTPHDEISRVRVETAKRFMRDSELKLYDISSRCGFSTLKWFYITFRKVTGTTPAAYRRACRSAAHSPN